ncbi:hydroxylamine reductase [Robinsoniella peoriensis]
MMNKMFCFQCEQTAGCTGCTGKSGVCGKKESTARLQDQLTGALIGLARATDGNTPSASTHRIMIEGLFATLTNVSFDDEAIEKLISRVHQEKDALIPKCGSCGSPCSRNDDYDCDMLWNAQEDIRSLKSLILFGLRGMAAYAYHAMVLGYQDTQVNEFFYKGLFAVGYDYTMEELLPFVMETGQINLKCMELLDTANTKTYGTPSPKTVSLTMEKGPFIVISGHDLHDLALLLEQTKDTGIQIYTHGEMLPAHAYPKLNAYPHLKGHFGTAWQNQQKEFADIPAPVLFTTNCLMPPKESYQDRVFTTAEVAYPGMAHIDEAGGTKDFSPVIKKALELGGYDKAVTIPGINGGTQVTTGFGHDTVLAAADTVINAVNSGDLKHIFLVGGCDGAKPGRNYYTDFVKQTPADSLILTLACGKFRFNDLDLGTLGGLPRILDMGQCNDAFSAIKVAVALANAFSCDVNELPLTLVLSWYEQKAVCILLTLLSLGIKNIYLGPTLPAFISPNVLEYLVANFNIHPTGDAGEDLKEILGK